MANPTQTTQQIDLHAPTALAAKVVRGIHDDQLDGPTVCTESSVSDLLDHVEGLTLAFTYAATKTPIPAGKSSPSAEGSRLAPGWRDRIADALGGLAAAWDEPTAYHGNTQAGPVELPAGVAALVALNEVVVHGWDLAHATARSTTPTRRPSSSAWTSCAASSRRRGVLATTAVSSARPSRSRTTRPHSTL